jgi:hemoglobin-like flavoprotein
MGLTAEEETAIRDTWSLVSKDLKGNGVHFFIYFFKGYPEYQKLFRGFADVPLDQLAENKRLKAHAFTVMNAINGLVDNLDDPEVLTELLIKTGQNHQKRKVKPGDFQNLKQSLLEFFGVALGDAWTPVASGAWEKLLTVMMAKISEGLTLAE